MNIAITIILILLESTINPGPIKRPNSAITKKLSDTISLYQTKAAEQEELATKDQIKIEQNLKNQTFEQVENLVESASTAWDNTAKMWFQIVKELESAGYNSEITRYLEQAITCWTNSAILWEKFASRTTTNFCKTTKNNKTNKSKSQITSIAILWENIAKIYWNISCHLSLHEHRSNSTDFLYKSERCWSMAASTWMEIDQARSKALDCFEESITCWTNIIKSWEVEAKKQRLAGNLYDYATCHQKVVLGKIKRLVIFHKKEKVYKDLSSN